ncbi:MAG: carbohydrate ABC transporter permease [Firmicutes bacterium]|jgi:multiple sugar transport system permease protein|nr:carbohydrate ABC transporter permease [Bacillota bacterium]NLL87635.1 carbohydrate ABC transporter permease [Bacillota bacterium]HKM17952.1 carbohydrate ABC transporter permease [Limnochordia bacterium]
MAAAQHKRYWKRNLPGYGWSLVRAVILIGVCYIVIFPILTKIASSFMSRNDLWDTTVVWIPRYPTLRNYELAWQYMNYPRAFWTSVKLSFIVSALQLASSTLVGYGIARFHFKGAKLLFTLAIVTLIVPPELFIIPLFLNFRYFDLLGLLPAKLDLINTVWPAVIMAATCTGPRNSLFIYIMRQYFKGMPRDLEEAAYVDGAGSFRTFYRIMLPAAVPAMVTVFLFAFVWQWNDYYMTQMFYSSATTLPMMLDKLPNSVLGMRWESSLPETSLLNNTGSLLLIAPLVILYIFLQKYFVESVQRTGITGQ